MIPYAAIWFIHMFDFIWRYSEAFAAFFIVSLYFFLILFYRWNNTVRAHRYLVQAEVANLQGRIAINRAVAANVPTCDQATALLTGIGEADRWPTFLFWCLGWELSAWQRIHDAEKLFSSILPVAQVKARLRSLIPGLQAPELLDRIKAKLGEQNADLDELRALLGEALKTHYDNLETVNLKIINRQNKLSWLNSAGLFFILVVAFTMGIYWHNSVLLLMGALGGFLSRLSRSMSTREDPNVGVSGEKGDDWARLFLSPTTGALSAWVGVLLIELLAENDVLGPSFKKVKWSPDPSTDTYTFTLGVAAALGISERFFDRVVSLVNNLGTPAAAPARTPAAAPPPDNAAANQAAQPAIYELRAPQAGQFVLAANLAAETEITPATVLGTIAGQQVTAQQAGLPAGTRAALTEVDLVANNAEVAAQDIIFRARRVPPQA